MARQFKIEQELNISASDYWKKLFLSEDYHRALYVEGLGFDYELSEYDHETGIRESKMTPHIEAPKAITKIFGESLAVREIGEVDVEGNKYSFEVIPSKLSNKINIHGTQRMISKGDNRCIRSVEMNIEVSILGVSSIIESFVESSTRKNYEKSSQFTEQYIQKMNH